MNRIKKKILICNFTKTISSAVLTAIAINIIMTNATKWSLIEGLLPFTLAIVIVALIDFYEYRCEREDKTNLDELESRCLLNSKDLNHYRDNKILELGACPGKKALQYSGTDHTINTINTTKSEE